MILNDLWRRHSIRAATLLLLLALPGRAAEFPLETVICPASESVRMPGVSGVTLHFHPPDGLTDEPTCVSSYPLYGLMEVGCVVRLDESRGTGSGYDRLLVDLNGDGSLADEKPSATVEPRRLSRESKSNSVFGPIRMARSAEQRAWQSAFFATLTLYGRERPGKGPARSDLPAGYLIVKPASFARAQVEMGGHKEAIGFLDGDGNLALGDVASFRRGTKIQARDWEWLRADYLFRDKDGSGAFERRRVGDELELFSNPIYFMGSPFRIEFPAEARVRFEPCTDLATFVIPSQCRIESLSLLRRGKDSTWQVLVTQPVNNTVQVPADTYRLFSCSYRVSRGQEEFVGQGYMNVPGQEYAVAPGQTISFPCGPPLKASVVTVNSSNDAGSILGLLERSQVLLSLRAHILGSGGETYSAFYRGKRYPERVAPRFPHYEISGQAIGMSSGTLRREADGTFSKVISLPSQAVRSPAKVIVRFDLQALGFASSATATAPIVSPIP